MSKCIVFLHGFPDSDLSWEYQKNEFSEYDVFTPNLNEYQSLNLDVVCSYLDGMTQKYEERYIVCHDLGGVYGDYFARHYKCKKVIFINSYGLDYFFTKLYDVKQCRKSWYMILMQIPFIDCLFNLNLKKMKNIIYDKGLLPKEDTLRKTSHDFYLVKLYKVFFQKWLENKPASGLVTSSFILSLEDNFLSIPKKDDLERFYPNMSLRVLPGGHWIHREDSQNVNRIILKELEC